MAFKPQIATEKKNYEDIRMGKEETILDKFIEYAKDAQQKYARQHKPFCYVCIKFDFDDELRRQKEEHLRKYGKINMAEINVEFPKIEKYVGEERFVLIKKKPIRGTIIMDGVKVPKLINYEYNYRCKIRGCGNTVDMPIKDEALEQELEYEKKDKEKKIE